MGVKGLNFNGRAINVPQNQNYSVVLEIPWVPSLHIHVGLVAVTLTLLAIYSFKLSVSPHFFSCRPPSVPLSDRLWKNKQKINVGRQKVFNFSVHANSNFDIRAAIGRVEMWPLNDKISSEVVSSSPDFLYRFIWTIIGG